MIKNKIKMIYLVGILPIIGFWLYLRKKSHNINYLIEKDKFLGLSLPIFRNGRFNNPWPTWKDPSFTNVLKWKLFYKDKSNVPSDPKVLDENLPVHQITHKEINDFCNQDTTNKFKVIWIGHATSLINFENKIIIMDPVFSERVSPIQKAGPKRFRPVPITIDRIPRIDIVLISHNHYDHLDEQSIMDLNKNFGEKGINWFVGNGVGEWFRDSGINKNVHELGWWQSKKYKDIEFVFTPAQHWSARGVFDRNKALWGSWTILGQKKKVFFGGDSGYCPGFKEIGNKYGPFDYSFIPIGAYEPRWMMEAQHVDPEEAVKIHMDIKSNKSFAIHWATFALASEYYLEPKQKLTEALQKFILDKNDFLTLKHGKVYEF